MNFDYMKLLRSMFVCSFFALCSQVSFAADAQDPQRGKGAGNGETSRVSEVGEWVSENKRSVLAVAGGALLLYLGYQWLNGEKTPTQTDEDIASDEFCAFVHDVCSVKAIADRVCKNAAQDPHLALNDKDFMRRLDANGKRGLLKFLEDFSVKYAFNSLDAILREDQKDLKDKIFPNVEGLRKMKQERSMNGEQKDFIDDVITCLQVYEAQQKELRPTISRR